MADFLALADGKAGAVQTVINDNAALADGSRAAGDYNNATNRDPLCDVYLTVQFDTTAPSAGTLVAELYVLFGDGAGSQVYPNGGDAGLGTNHTPQASHLAGVFETVAPSTSVNEVLSIHDVALGAHGNRFVLLNTSGQQFDLTWQLDIRPKRYENVGS